MDNLCVLGVGLLGLLFITSKNKKPQDKLDTENTPIDNIIHTSTDNNNVTVTGDDMESVGKSFANNKFMKQLDNDIEWVIPEDEVLEHPLHPFTGLDYMKITIVDNEPITTIGRYMIISEEFKNTLQIIVPTVEFSNTIDTPEGVMTLVKDTNKYITISAITLNFAENVIEDLSICKLKNLYKKVVKNYTCKKLIEPPIEWFNPELFDSHTHLHKDLCEEGDTSALETEQLVESDLLAETNTSLMDSDAFTTDANESKLDDFEDSLTSENSELTSDDEESKLDNIEDSATSIDENEPVMSQTSVENVELDNLSDTSYNDIEENVDKSEKEEPKKKSTKKKSKKKSSKKKSKKKSSKKKSSAKKVSGGKKFSAKKVSGGKKSSAKKVSGGKKSSAKKVSGGKKSSAKKVSGGKKKKGSKKVKTSKKKKESKKKKGSKKIKTSKKKGSKKKKKNSAKKLHTKLDSDISGGSSSSLTNTRRSILGRF